MHLGLQVSRYHSGMSKTWVPAQQPGHLHKNIYRPDETLDFSGFWWISWISQLSHSRCLGFFHALELLGDLARTSSVPRSVPAVTMAWRAMTGTMVSVPWAEWWSSFSNILELMLIVGFAGLLDPMSSQGGLENYWMRTCCFRNRNIFRMLFWTHSWMCKNFCVKKLLRVKASLWKTSLCKNLCVCGPSAQM